MEYPTACLQEMRSKRLSERRERLKSRLLAALLDHAKRQAPCPKNADLMTLIGAQGHSRVTDLLALLAREGRIEIEYNGPSRAVRRITVDGQSTGWTEKPSGVAAVQVDLPPAAEVDQMWLVMRGRRFENITLAEARRIRV